ncbi:hypothetical protein V493_04420 [Pseudogymnoascus sp. VKM F-4281 (FW-2241)]|nr:hypothetical protein V493_04420 [Pseudogymnoascus sp. VKM F-4281 (FW-2241)]
MRLLIPSTAILAAGFVGQSAAIRAVPSSPCAPLCGDVTSTTGSDILCTAADLRTNKGQPCLTSRACEPFQGNLQYKGLSPNISTYDYCPNLPFEAEKRCRDCIQQGDQTYLSNYMATIIGGCAVQNSAPIHLDHTLFGADYVQVTDGTSSKSTSGSPAMSLGTRIGIAIGGICFLLALIGITIVCCGRRRRRAKIAERQRRAEEYTGFGSVNRVLPAPRVTTKWESDMSGVMEESPMSANAYLNDKHGFSPYSSQYNSPISARDVVAPQQWEWPQQPGFEMDRVRTAGTPVDKEQEDQRLHQEWAMEAATRGFTVSPMMPPPPPPPRAKQ